MPQPSSSREKDLGRERGEDSRVERDEEAKSGGSTESELHEESAPQVEQRDRQQSTQSQITTSTDQERVQRKTSSYDSASTPTKVRELSPPPKAAEPTIFMPSPIDLHNMRAFLTRPAPAVAGVVQCYIKRNKTGTNKLFPEYSVYLKDSEKFLMCSKKRPNNRTSNYLISMKEGDHNREGPNYLGKVRANFVGTDFQIFDHGVNPKESHGNSGGDMSIPLPFLPARRELGCVIYARNVLGSRGPRKMQVAIPNVNSKNEIDAWGPGTGSRSKGNDLLASLKEVESTYDEDEKQPPSSDLMYMINKPPRWNDQVGAYVLNFNGRVTMASVKNFQLVPADDTEKIVLQFGRVAKDEFTMDFQHPITPMQAFSITLSSFDSKIACD
ncbi:unnamed protein product [Chrysoparadoxa australica]